MLPTLELERELQGQGYQLVAGIDEAGRGALAGPVVAAAVILPEDFSLKGVRDSKLIPELEREALYDKVISSVLAYGIGIVDNEVIDKINILQSTFVAMRTAVEQIQIRPDVALIDGRDAPEVGVPAKAVIKGDAISVSIAAASIVAKVTRDRIMRDHHALFPEYGFDKNKGYGTRTHREAIERVGSCTLHRLTFLGNLRQERLSL
ncbi:MAG: ribonuclease HII [Ignavibacteriae bacterium]|nr:ribonuclease HII [Ignavibacteriota bacterium]MCB9215468.1 ribonuclease HII [Ignavibacteria bacterium]